MSIIPWHDPVLLKLVFTYKTKYSLQLDHVPDNTVGITSYPYRGFKVSDKTNSLSDPMHLTMLKILRSHTESSAKKKKQQKKKPESSIVYKSNSLK